MFPRLPLSRPICLLLILTASAACPAGAAEFIALGDVVGGPGLSAERYHRFWGLSRNGSAVVGTIGQILDSRGLPRNNSLFRWTRQTGTVDLGIEAFSAKTTYDGSALLSQAVFVDGTNRVSSLTSWTTDTGVGPTVTFHRDTPFQFFGLGGSATGSRILVQLYPLDEWFAWDATEGLRSWVPEEDGFLGLPEVDGSHHFLPNDVVGSGVYVSLDGSTVAGTFRRVVDNVEQETRFRWTEATGLEELGPPRQLGSGPFLFGNDMSADGSVIYGYDGQTTIRWTRESGIQELLPFVLNSTNTTDDGTMLVGSASDAENGLEPFTTYIWRDGKPTMTLPDFLATEAGLSVEIAGWKFDQARIDISADGLAMAGLATNPQGLREAYYVDLHATVPEPMLASPFTVGFLAASLIVFQRKRMDIQKRVRRA